MKVILQKQVDSLGEPGEVIQVADGYARNYLIPRGLAAPATKGALRHAERVKVGHEERARRQRAEAEVLAGRLTRLANRAGWQTTPRGGRGAAGRAGRQQQPAAPARMPTKPGHGTSTGHAP